MTISATSYSADSYSGNDSTTTFPITFDYHAEGHIVVYLVNDGTGVAALQTITTHYTIDSSDNVEMITEPATGETLLICRATAQTQAVNLVKGGAFYPETIETAYDKLCLSVQELWEALGRAIKFGPTSSEADIDLPEPSASTILAWNSGADGLENLTIGIADNNIVQMDDADAAENDFVKLTASGLAGRSYAETLSDLSGEAAADFSMASNKITDVTDPAADQDAATKKYVDDNIPSGVGFGSMNAVKEAGVQLGGSDIEVLDFDGDHFNLSESPDAEINITLANPFTEADETKLDGIAAGATVYPDTGEQAFLDADHSKLDAIEASADVTDATNVAAAGAVMADGSNPLTADWDVGAYKITGTQFVSDIAIGTAPFVVTSTTVVSNLNADLLDGKEGSAYVNDSDFTQDSGVLVGTGAGIYQEETGATLRTSLGLAIGTDVLAEQTIGIADDNLVEVDGTPVDGEVTVWTANGLDSKSEAEFKTAFNMEAGTDYLAQQTIGIADNNLVEVDGTPVDTEVAIWTATGLDSNSEAEFKTAFNLGGWIQTTGTFTATPASTSTITMTSDLTASILVGYPLQYAIGGTTYYGICTAIASNLLTVGGAPLSGDVTALYYGDPTMVSQVTYDNSKSVSVLTTGTVHTLRWKKTKSYLVYYDAYQVVHDTHATHGKATVKINATEVNTSAGGLTVAADTTWYETVVDIAVAAYDVNTDEDITLVVTEGGNVDGYGLIMNLLFVTP